MLEDWGKVELLGHGTYGEVWLVRNRAGQQGVLKLLPAELAAIHDRASHELLPLAHPNLQRTLEVTNSYVVTEFVDGQPLTEVLRRRGKLSVGEVRRLGNGLLRGLEFLHQRALVHRDVKPDNILIPGGDAFDDVVLIDFSLVGRRQPNHEHSTTMSGALVGSPAYMAPEQIHGKGLTSSADIWGVGAVLYEASVGVRPFEATSFAQQVLRTIQGDADFDAVPDALRPTIRWALQPDPARRAQTARELADMLGGGPDPQVMREVDAAPAASMGAATTSVVSSSRSAASLPSAARTRLPPWLALVFLAAGATAFASVGSPLARPLAFSLLGGASTGVVLVMMLHRLQGVRERKTAGMRSRAASGQVITRSIAATVEALASRYRNNPHIDLMTQSMALVIERVESIKTTDPAAHLDVTLKALDAMMKLEARITEMASPWYIKYDKVVALVTAVGTAGVTWWGLGQSLVQASPSAAPLFTGCPDSPLDGATRVRLQASGTEALEWTNGKAASLISREFDWPADAAGQPPQPGARVIWARRGDRKQSCTIELREVAMPRPSASIE